MGSKGILPALFFLFPLLMTLVKLYLLNEKLDVFTNCATLTHYSLHALLSTVCFSQGRLI